MNGTSSKGTASSQGGNASQQRVEHDLQLGTGELLSDALVSAVAEAELLPDVTGQVQLLGFGICGASQFAGARSMMMPSPA